VEELQVVYYSSLYLKVNVSNIWNREDVMFDLISTINGFDVLMIIIGFFLGRLYDKIQEEREWRNRGMY
tara:strand:- start:87 stop:293 length:207 start_codon:yes stop_codon:yes gene_type:complete